MIQRIRWPYRASGELATPFMRGAGERGLRITFHLSSFTNASPKEKLALELLFELSRLEEIYALQTEPGLYPYIEIGKNDYDGNQIPVVVKDNEGQVVRMTGIRNVHYWQRIATDLAPENDPEYAETKATYADLLIAQAHCTFRQDILITLSPRLLEHQHEAYVDEANPRNPTDAAQLVGLFLRSRENFTYQHLPNMPSELDHGLFYWVLTRQRLPGMWRYFSACVHAEKARGDDILNLGQSILDRCMRAIQARDAIGEQFHVPQNNNTRDAIMYHFDYLTLLLAGAFDAQARIAYRSYDIKRPNEWSASFYGDSRGGGEFIKALGRTEENKLYALVREEYFQCVMTLLYTLRNTIHGASLPSLAFRANSDTEESLIQVDSPSFSRAVERLGSLDSWGIKHLHSFLVLEPYAFVSTLVMESLKLIDAIANATDVLRLFPDGYPVPKITDIPPKEEIYSEFVGSRLALLG